ncbi:MAG: hypothetical protein AB8F95_22340 [Bacteroidia bacterium]
MMIEKQTMHQGDIAQMRDELRGFSRELALPAFLIVPIIVIPVMFSQIGISRFKFSWKETTLGIVAIMAAMLFGIWWRRRKVVKDLEQQEKEVHTMHITAKRIQQAGRNKHIFETDDPAMPRLHVAENLYHTRKKGDTVAVALAVHSRILLHGEVVSILK